MKCEELKRRRKESRLGTGRKIEKRKRRGRHQSKRRNEQL
jgi:hypothetical protein